jgi:hypothetical protein
MCRRVVLNFSVGFLLVITLINFNVQRIWMELFTVLKHILVCESVRLLRNKGKNTDEPCGKLCLLPFSPVGSPTLRHLLIIRFICCRIIQEVRLATGWTTERLEFDSR